MCLHATIRQDSRTTYGWRCGSAEAICSGVRLLAACRYLEDRTVRLQLWDTAGQERFRSLIPSYIRDSSVAVIVYDITNRARWVSLLRWLLGAFCFAVAVVAMGAALPVVGCCCCCQDVTSVAGVG